MAINPSNADPKSSENAESDDLLFIDSNNEPLNKKFIKSKFKLDLKNLETLDSKIQRQSLEKNIEIIDRNSQNDNIVKNSLFDK